MEKRHYPNQNKVFVKKLKHAIIEVIDGHLYITAEFIDFGSEKYQSKMLKEYDRRKKSTTRK